MYFTCQTFHSEKLHKQLAHNYLMTHTFNLLFSKFKIIMSKHADILSFSANETLEPGES